MPTHTSNRGSHKYEPLADFLRRQSRAVVPMSFREIERVIGSKLPPSAVQHRAWWSNNAQNNVMTKAWKDAGFETEDVDMKNRRVAFRRVQSGTRDNIAPSIDVTTNDRHPLLGWMKGTLTIADGVDLAQPADLEWGDAAYGERTWAGQK